MSLCLHPLPPNPTKSQEVQDEASESEFQSKVFPEIASVARCGVKATEEWSCGSGLPPPLSTLVAPASLLRSGSPVSSSGSLAQL